MNSCKYIKERIDEADKPDLLSLEVSEHIGRCDDCGRFAIERSALRKLVASDIRVNAPINFDAMLKIRLAEVKGRRSFWWLGSPGYLRLGAATAGLVVMFFAAQYAGLFTDNRERTTEPDVVSNNTKPAPGRDERLSTPPGFAPLPLVSPAQKPAPYASVSLVSSTPKVRRGDVPVTSVAPAGYITAEDGGVVLVRGRNGDIDVQMPTVSVGAQPLLYVSASQRAVRSVGTSF